MRIAILFTSLLTACAAQPKKTGPDPRDERIAQLEQQQRELQRQVQEAQLRSTELAAQLDVAEVRLGLRPFQPRVLKAWPGELKWTPGRAKLITQHRGKPRKVDLRKWGKERGTFVVAWWATWCKPCTSVEELEALKRLKGDLERVGSTLIGVAVDELSKVRGHKRAAEWHYPIWHKRDGNIEWLPKRFIEKVGLGLPLFLVVRGDGRVLYWHTSALDAASYEELLTAAARG